MKTLSYIGAVVIIYFMIAIASLLRSDYLEIIAFYTEPPTLYDIFDGRLPIIGGDAICVEILKHRKADANNLIERGGISMAAVLASYRHSINLPILEAKDRALTIAEILVDHGYDLRSCENSGESTAEVLKRWGWLEPDIISFLDRKLGGDIFVCR